MVHTLDEKKVAKTLAVWVGLIYILCVLAFALFPTLALSISQNLFHGIDITQIAKSMVSFGSILIGLIEAVVLSYIAGWLLAVTYNRVK